MNAGTASVEASARIRELIAERSLTFASYLAPTMMPIYRHVAERIGTTLGCETRVVVGESFDQISAGEVDVAFVCGWPYVRLADIRPSPVELLAAPVLRGARYAGRPVYFSDIIVRADSRLQSFADLRGCAWSYNEPLSYSGYLATLFRLVQLGQTRGFFGTVVEAGWHEDSIKMVVSGDVDASAIDSQVLWIELRRHPQLRTQLRVIDTLGPAPIQPIVAGRHLPQRIRTAIRDTLLSLGAERADKRLLAQGGVDRFVAVSNEFYDVIRHIALEVARTGLTEIR